MKGTFGLLTVGTTTSLLMLETILYWSVCLVAQNILKIKHSQPCGLLLFFLVRGMGRSNKKSLTPQAGKVRTGCVWSALHAVVCMCDGRVSHLLRKGSGEHPSYYIYHSSFETSAERELLFWDTCIEWQGF